MFRVSTLLVICFVFLTQAAQAQAQHLQGKILDPSKKPVPSAPLTVLDSSGHAVYRGTSNNTGEFSIPLSFGRYQIKVERDGFNPQNISINFSTRDQVIAITLSIKSEITSVTVSDQAKQLDLASDSHQDSLKLEASDLGDLPIRDGDVISALAFFANPSGGQSPTIIIDGMERTDSVALSPSEVQEVRLNNNAYSVEFPKPGKDRIEIDTKGGSDQLHGAFVFRARNSIFDARNPFTPKKLSFSRDGYEANLSGPILKRRLFFFVDAERENQQQEEPILAYLPSGLLQEGVLAPFNRDSLLGRLDWQISEGHRASAKYEFHQEEASSVGVGGFVLPQAGATMFHHDDRIELSDQYVVSPNALNNFRLALGTNYQQIESLTSAPAVVVPGAFQEGGAQMDHYNKESRYEFQDRFSWVKGSLTVKAGGEANLHPFHSYSADNFGGTYQFASLAAYEATQPLLYTVSAGNPLIVSAQDDYAWYIQVEKQFSRISLFAGVRHEFQSHFDRYANLAPRLAMSISLDRSRNTILRAGGGVFYDRRPPTILQQVDRFNGLSTRQYLIESPTYPVGSSFGPDSQPISTIFQLDSSMTLPRIYQTSATLERQLPGGFRASADLTYQRGNHLFRTRNINAPLPVTLLRPDPLSGNVDQIESSASSREEMFNLALKTPPKKPYQLFFQYTLAEMHDNTGDVFGPTPPGGMLAPGHSAGNLFALPADNYNLHPEWGPASDDIRNRIGVSATVHLPWRVNLGTLTSFHTGLPYDITTGYDNNQDGDANDRPPGITRNTGREAGFFSIDAQISRPVSFLIAGRKIDCELAIDSFNLLNHVNPSSYVGVETSPLFGKANAAYDGREMQFSIQARF